MKNKFVLLMLLFSYGSIVNSEEWDCTNDFEAQCENGKCKIAEGENFTPLSVSITDVGDFSVCAYSGCWKGKGKVLSKYPFLTIIAADVVWSNSNSKNDSHILIALNLDVETAILHAGSFVQPLICKITHDKSRHQKTSKETRL